MISPRKLAREFARNVAIVRMQCEGLSHADSLAQTPYNINCLNWVVGHLIVSRDDVLRRVDAEPLMTDAEAERYRRESDPITEDGPDVIQLERLLELLSESQDRLARTLGTMTEEEAGIEVPVGDRDTKLGSLIHFWYFHDTYHTGQTDLLRQVAGANDKVI